jgi:predicted DNA-binding antitoxin AbrB/MazE fold protein
MIVEVIYQDGAFRPVEPLIGVSEGQAAWVAVGAVGDPNAADQVRLQKDLLSWLAAAGRLDNPPMPIDPRPIDEGPLSIPGPPLSQTILEDRD